MHERRSFQQELIALMRRLELSQADIGRRTGISSAWLSQMVKNGKVPSRESVRQLVEGLDLGYEDRARLYAAAGYAADAEVPGGTLPQPVVSLAMELAPLSPRQLEVVRWLARDPQRLDGIALLRDSRVMLALAAA
jgi:transcriptional regulator with XRE-family HTH domain